MLVYKSTEFISWSPNSFSRIQKVSAAYLLFGFEVTYFTLPYSHVDLAVHWFNVGTLEVAWSKCFSGDIDVSALATVTNTTLYDR